MSDAAAYSISEALLLWLGARMLSDPPHPIPGNPAEYWLDNGKTRPTTWNSPWINSPRALQRSVPHRDWILSNLIASMVGGQQDLTAITEPMVASLDLFGSEIKPGMRSPSREIAAIVESEGGYQRALVTTLTIGLSQRVSEGKDVLVFGAGIRRSARVWLKGADESDALQAAFELYAPFAVVGGDRTIATEWPFPDARSICAGIAVTRSNGGAIGADAAGHDIAGLRFNFRLPFRARIADRRDQKIGDLETIFGPPEVLAQQRLLTPANQHAPAVWEASKDWKAIVERLAESTEGKELLEAPFGPILLKELSDSSFEDLYQFDRVTSDLADAKKELRDARELLKALRNRQPPDPGTEPTAPDTLAPKPLAARTLGALLDTLGLMAKGKVGKLDTLTAWDVLGRLLDELDGLPLWVRDPEGKDDAGPRAAVALVSETDATNTGRHYFGIGGLAYDIPVKVAKKNKDTDVGDTGPGDTSAGTGSDRGPLVYSDDEDDDNDDPLVPVDDPLVAVDPDEDKDEGTDEPRPPVEVYLHLGKWFTGETLDDNWFRRLLPPVQTESKSVWKRRAPLPGIRLLPVRQDPFAASEQGPDRDKAQAAHYALTLRGDLLSLGFDLRRRTEEGLTFLKRNSGPLSYFGLGAIEARIALLLLQERIAVGFGLKLANMRLSLGQKLKDDKDGAKSTDGELLAPLAQILGNDDDPAEWAAVPISDSDRKKTAPGKPRTRLTSKQQDTFSLSVGYLSPLTDGSLGTLDVQLYNHKGKRGEAISIPVDRRAKALYLKNIGIALKGAENIELGKPAGDDAQLAISLTGGVRLSWFELGLIGAKLIIPLARPRDLQLGLDGLDLSVVFDPMTISGSFLKQDDSFAGHLTIDLPSLASISAMGAIGKVVVVTQKAAATDEGDLTKGVLPPALSTALAAKGVTKSNAVRGTSPWSFPATDGHTYSIERRGSDLKVFSDETSLFIYGALSAARGGGVTAGPITFTGVALGVGVHRRVNVPPVEKVAEFPFVQMVMGAGGYKKDEIGNPVAEQLGKPVDDPLKVLEKMQKDLPVERGQYFFCAGVRFTVAQTADCFGLLIVQFGNELELTLLGLARIRQPRDVSAKPICFIELQILLSVKPSEGCVKLQAALTNKSWVVSPACRLTGGFALYVWFSGRHKGDFVITLGGYHPRFRRPSHYPVVPRVGLQWQLSESLRIKGELYFAVTASCFMLGARLEASFYAARVSVWFTAYLDTLISWSPLHYELDMGVVIRAEVDVFLFTLRLTVATTLQLWGPPDGGVIHLELSVLTLDVPFGTPREQAKPQLITSWAEFCRSFLPTTSADTPTPPPFTPPTVQGNVVDGGARGARRATAPGTPPPVAPPTVQANLVNGRARGARRATAPEAIEEWSVRADSLTLGAATPIPVTTLNVGRAAANGPPREVQERREALVLEPTDLRTTRYASPLGVHPMGRTFESALNVTIVRDEVSGLRPVDLRDWVMAVETAALPAALWDPSAPRPTGPTEPDARLMEDCIVGVRSLTPPVGGYGNRVLPTAGRWAHLEPAHLTWPAEQQTIPTAVAGRALEPSLNASRTERRDIFDALTAAGFDLSVPPTDDTVRFRDLQAEPLAGAVATFA